VIQFVGADNRTICARAARALTFKLDADDSNKGSAGKPEGWVRIWGNVMRDRGGIWNGLVPFGVDRASIGFAGAMLACSIMIFVLLSIGMWLKVSDLFASGLSASADVLAFVSILLCSGLLLEAGSRG